MDTMRGGFGPLSAGPEPDYDGWEDDASTQAPPPAIGQDERRMQVRAYNHWASLLEDRNFPGIEDLEPESLPDFGPYSVLLDFSSGIEDPGISYLGSELAGECGAGDAQLRTLADVPARSLLTRITDHYMQILANQAPIGFEAEFVNQHGATVAYRGILLPFSSDDDTIDFIFGVINWKELADPRAADELLLEIDQALEPRQPAANEAPLTDWADGPGADSPDAPRVTPDVAPATIGGDGFPVANSEMEAFADEPASDLPLPSFGLDGLDEDEVDEERDQPSGSSDGDQAIGRGRRSAFGSLLKMPLAYSGAPEKTPLDLGEAVAGTTFDLGTFDPAAPDLSDESAVPTLAALPADPAHMELADWLAAARQMAAAANGSEDRTRQALYEALGRAYDFSLAAAEAPREFEQLLADAGLRMQQRAPLTPVVKLVFGAEYDKTRLTEYAAALAHARRLELPRGALGGYLGAAEGGLKGVVKAERQLRREQAGHSGETSEAPRRAVARKLRALPPQEFEAISAEGSEFGLVLIRRTEAGEVVVLGEVPPDPPLVERAARRLIA